MTILDEGNVSNSQVLRYARDIESHLRLADDAPANAALTGIITTIRSSGSIRFLNLRDATGAVQIVAERDELRWEDWRQVCDLKPGTRVTVRGRVGRTKRGQSSLFLRRAPELRDTSLSSPIAGSEADYAAVGTQMLLARLHSRAGDYLRKSGYVEIEPKYISAEWKSHGLEPLHVVYPGFGVACYLAPTPGPQLLDAIISTGADAVFAVSRCFSTTYRDEKSSAESLIVAAKSVDLQPGEHHDLVRDGVAWIFGDFETMPEAGLFPRRQWRQVRFGSALADHHADPVSVPTLEIYESPNISRGTSSVQVVELFRLIWPPRRTIAEGSQERLDAGLLIASTTLHLERMVTLLRDVPVRLIRNLGERT